MSGDVNKDSRMRGFALQCPWSKCFPQLYDRIPRLPCTNTAFADFREVSDHIWKYHSFILSCDKCIHRFLDGKRGEKNRPALIRLKNEHMKKFHSDKGKDTSRNPQDLIRTMTEEQDRMLREWKATDKWNEETVKSNYKSLCFILFGNDVEVPANIRYNYLVAEHTIYPESASLGKRNEAYALQHLVPARLASTYDFQQPLTIDPYQFTQDRFSLDDCAPVNDWAVTKQAPDQDSGYGSKPHGETAVQAQPNNVYMEPTWNYDSSWPQPDNNMEFAAMTGDYFCEALHELPPFEVEGGDGSDEPVG